MTTSGGASAVHKPALRGVQHQWAAVVAAIAGAYLVFSANDPQSRIAVAIYTASLVLLLAVWSGAAVGIVVSMFWPAAPKWVGAVLAIAAGYTIVPYFGPIVRHMSTVELTLIIVGGVAYTVGAIVQAAKRPNPWPRTYGYHEIFHALTLVGAGLQMAAVISIARGHVPAG